MRTKAAAQKFVRDFAAGEKELRERGEIPEAWEGHTPGPWRWIWNGTGGNWALVHGGENAFNLDYIRVGGPPDLPLSPDQHLVQAAPELLAERDSLRAENAKLREAAQAALFALDFDSTRTLEKYEKAYGAIRSRLRAALAPKSDAGL